MNKNNFFTSLMLMFDGAFSTSIGAGWSRWADSLILRDALSTRKSNRDKVTRRGSASRLLPMPKSVLSSQERKRSTTLDASLLHTFLW